VPLDLNRLELASAMDEDQLLALHEALQRLAAHDPVKAELVKLRFFVGLTLEEAAKVLGFSTPTAKRHWAYARAWLYREIKRGLDG
ncbi:MAG: RNA polymerase subunit sigma, partial [Verrucomicrobia bacterium]|nr:RNA polymerase subunit sigma [Verrucomicrobiota bacterium]